jgi:hypothetical protein
MTVAAEIQKPRERSRMVYAVAVVLVIATGLLWRSSWIPLPPILSKYGGDALWSLLVFTGLGFLFPCSSTRLNVIRALVVSFAVEFSQLYHAPWIDTIRRTRIGALAIGSVFNAPDLAAYAAGVLIGALIEWTARRTAKS